jgi:hypothetical protein
LLLIDYVLTVSVSVAVGIDARLAQPGVPALRPSLALAIVATVALINLRGA